MIIFILIVFLFSCLFGIVSETKKRYTDRKNYFKQLQQAEAEQAEREAQQEAKKENTLAHYEQQQRDISEMYDIIISELEYITDEQKKLVFLNKRATLDHKYFLLKQKIDKLKKEPPF